MGKASISISITSAFNDAGITKASTSLSQFGSAISRMEKLTAASAASTQADLAKMSARWQDAGNRLTEYGKKMETVGAALTKSVTLPMITAGAYAGTMAVKFDTAMADLRKVSNMTEGELEEFAQSALKLSKTQPVDASTILSVEALGKQLGVSQGKLESFAKVATGLDIATNMDADTAATEMARFANIVGMTEDEYSNYGSTLVNIGNTMATTESEVSQMAQRFASAGSQAGLTEAEILGISGAMSSLGIKAEMGGSALSQVFISISKSVSSGGKDLEAFASVAGMSADQFAQAWKTNAADAFTALLDGISKANAAGTDVNTVLSELGIESIRQSDVMRRLAGNTSLVTNAIDESRQAWEQNSALQAEVDQRNESMASRLQVLKNKVDAIAITVGRPLVNALIDVADVLDPVIQTVAKAAQTFADMDTEGQRNVLMWAGIAAAAGPVLSVMGKVTQAVGSGVSMFGQFAQKASVYADALKTVDGSQMRTYASADSMASKLGIAGNKAVKAAGSAEKYVQAWEGMYSSAREVSAQTDKMNQLLEQSAVASGDSKVSLLKQASAAESAALAAEKNFKANGQLVSSYTGSTKEMQKWADICDEATGGQTNLAESVKNVNKSVSTATGEVQTASKSFGELAKSATPTATGISKIGSMASFAAKSLGSMFLQFGQVALATVAIAAIAAVVGTVIDAYTKWQERQSDLAEASESFADMQDRIAQKADAASGSFRDYASSVDEVAESCNDALKDTISLGDSIEQTLTDVAVNSAELDGYVATIDDLANQSNLSAAQQTALQTAVKGYNSITGDQISVIDAVNGKLQDQNGNLLDNTGQLDANAKAWVRNAEAQAAQQALIDVQKQHLINQQNLTAAQEKYDEAVAKVKKEYPDILDFYVDLQPEVAKAKSALEEAQAATDGTADSLEGLTATAAIAGSKLSEDFTNAVKSLPQSMQTVGVDIATNLQTGVESGAYLASDAAEFLTDTVKGAVSKLPDSMQDQGLDIANKLSAGVSSGKMTLEQASTFLTSTVDSVVSKMPAEMKGKGLDAAKSLASDLSSGNVTVEQAATILNAAANGGLASLPTDLSAKATDAVKNLNTAISAGSSGTLAAATGVKNSANQGVSNLSQDFANKGSQSGMSLASALGSQAANARGNAASLAGAASGGVSGLPGQMSSVAVNASNGFASGIGAGRERTQANADSVAAAARRMGNAGDSYSWGSHLGANFASGISAAIGRVSNAAKSIVDAAKNIMKFSVPKEGPFSGAEKGGMTSGMHLAQNWAAGIDRGIPDVIAASERLASAAKFSVEGNVMASAVPSAQLASPAASATTVNNYTVQIDGTRIESASPRAMELIKALFNEYQLTAEMG